MRRGYKKEIVKHKALSDLYIVMCLIFWIHNNDKSDRAFPKSVILSREQTLIIL